MTLITVLVNISIISAISIDEIRANPSKYVLVHSGAQQEEYILTFMEYLRTEKP